jgi:isopentenyldiphosphate isomerase
MDDFVESPGELIRCFDDNGKEIAPKLRSEVHTKPLQYWHATTGIYVINRKGELLCSKRSENHSYRPGYWQGCFGGHVRSGESYEQNAIKELYEEAGFNVPGADLHFLEEAKYGHSKHLAKLYLYLFDGDLKDIHCKDGEITETKWMDMEEFWREKSEAGEVGASTCPPDVQEKIKKYLIPYV